MIGLSVPEAASASALIHDDFDDLPVGLRHPLAGQRAKIGNGVVNVVGDDTFPAADA